MIRAPAVLYELIRRFEGLRLRSYLCPARVWTIGFGSTGPGIGPGVVWTHAQSVARMQEDAQVFVLGSAAQIPGIGGDRLAAISDFSYNLGLTRLRGSTLRKKALAGNWPAVCTELRKWTRGGGRVLPGLVLRREAECALIRRNSQN